MEDRKLVHQKTLLVAGEAYSIEVYSRDDGGLFAETRFDDRDIIVSDGGDLEDVLSRHERLVPLAVDSRKVLSRSSSFLLRSKGYRAR